MTKFEIVQPIIRTTAPLGTPAAWEAVMNRSGGRCQCIGACGRSHSKTEFRCDREHRGPVRLLIAPADLTLPPIAAARVPVPELRAWCTDCHRLARRRQNEAAAARARLDSPPTAGLFDL